MLKVIGASSKVIGGRLQVQIDLKGDLPGHPFRGNQWEGSGGRGSGEQADKTTPEEKVAFASRASALADKMSGYAKEYENEGKPEFASQCESIALKLRDGKVVEANAELREGDLRYDINNTSIAVQDLKDEMTIASTIGTDWGTKPGTYTAYRSGEVKNTNRGIFLAADESGARAYGRSRENGVDVAPEQYQIQIKNPYTAPRAEDALAEFTGKSTEQIYRERDRAGNVGNWWMKMDAKVMKLAKERGHDALVWTKPAPPALREVVVFDSSQVTKQGR